MGSRKISTEIVHFKANAAVKDIVGQGLIYDDNVAIIELVKNAKDAASEKAIIYFDEIANDSQSSSITIKDYGMGMSLDDIRNKWLNIAYSEKKGALLNDTSPYAGNKGVGRFSCDRLGSELTLYTKSEQGDYLKLPINWEEFENRDQDDEISNINLTCHAIDRENFLSEIDDKDFQHGTVLKIQNLRSKWNNKKLKKLVAELEKFSPSLDQTFEVYIYTSEEVNDAALEKKLNKKINSNILDKLSFKTTYIKSSIDKEGQFISTTLYYQGDEVYKYKAKNPYTNLKNISTEIHFLDALAKAYFTRNIGVRSNNYGSIFLFYNDFRISPYGNPKNDWLGLDQRKSQGTARNMGTREVFGRIDINDHDNSFSVITSREGLAHNKAYFDLAASDVEEQTTLANGKDAYGYVITIIRQLENFVVSGLDWNRVVERFVNDDTKRKKVIQEADIANAPDRYQLKAISIDKVKEACDRILRSNLEVIDFKFNDSLIKKIQKISEDKYKQYVKDFVKKTDNVTIKELSANKKGTVRKIIQHEQAKTQAAQKERDYAEFQRDKAEKKVQIEKERANLFEGMLSPETTLDALITHVMKQISGGIEKDVKSILYEFYKNPDQVSKQDLIQVLEDVIIDISTIRESTTMATKANFNMKVASIEEDLYAFVEDYLSEIASKDKKWGLQLHFSNNEKASCIRPFKPADICVLFVNLFDNSRKANAQNIWINIEKEKILIKDDGIGFDFENYDQNDFFIKGMSTTSGGSGLGMYHCKEILKNINADIAISNQDKKQGALITLEFK